MSGSIDIGVPDITVVIRENTDTNNVVLDVPNISVTVNRAPDYKINIQPSSLVVHKTGSLPSLAVSALTASYALSASYMASGTITSASYATFANNAATSTTASYALNAQGTGFPFSGSAIITGSLVVSQSGINVIGSVEITNNLNVGGILSANQLLVSSSIIYSSGSTKFGDSSDDTHQFTGSVLVDGPVNAPSFTGSFRGDGSQLTGIVSTLQITGSTGQDTIDLKTQGLLITGSNGINTVVTDNTVTIAAPQGTVSSSAQINVFDTTGGDNVATLGANTFVGNQTIFGTLEIDTGNIVVTSGNSLIISGAIFAQNEFIGGFVSASTIESPSITGSFKGDGSQLTGLVTDLRISGSVGSDVVSLLTDDLTITGQNGIVTIITDNTVTIDVPTALTASLYGTASFAENIDVIFAGNFEVGNEPPVALQVGGTGNIISASYALTASYAENAILPTGVVSSSTQINYTDIPNIPLGMISTSAQFNTLTNTSASYALTASYVLNNTQFNISQLSDNTLVGDTVSSSVGGNPIEINYGITKGDFANRFTGIKVYNYDWSGGNLAGQVEVWTDSDAQDFSTRRFYIDGFGKSAFTSNVEVTGSLTVSGSSTFTNIGPTVLSGSITFDGGGQIVQNYEGYTGAIDLKAGTPTAWAELQSYNSDQYVWVDDNGAYIGTNWNSGSQQWIFDQSGSLTAPGTISAPSFTGSLHGTSSWSNTAATASLLLGSIKSASYATTASYALAATAEVPRGTVSSSQQVLDYNIFATTGSNIFVGNQYVSGAIFFDGGSSITGNVANLELFADPTGEIILQQGFEFLKVSNQKVMVTNIEAISVTGSLSGSLIGTSSWASHVLFNNISGLPSGIVSSSAQTLSNISDQNIAPANVNATGTLSGSSIQVSGNGTVGGNLTVTGTLTATSQSIQYVTSSQFNVATNRIIVNTDNSLRFGGLTVIDSGSSGKSGSLYWDSLNDRWLYEDVSGNAYTSAILVAGPKNVGPTGQERGLLSGRVPVASGDDHIDTAAASSSIRVDFPTRLTHIEAGLYVTGSVSASSYTGSFTGSFTGLINSASYVTPTGLPSGLVSSSTQIANFGNIRLTVGTTNKNSGAAFYFNSNTVTAGDSASPGQDTAFLIQSTGLSTVTVYLRQSATGPNATVVGVAKNANGTAFSSATLVTSSSLSLSANTVQTYTFSGLTLNQFDAIHIYVDPTSAPTDVFGVILVS